MLCQPNRSPSFLHPHPTVIVIVQAFACSSGTFECAYVCRFLRSSSSVRTVAAMINTTAADALHSRRARLSRKLLCRSVELNMVHDGRWAISRCSGLVFVETASVQTRHEPCCWCGVPSNSASDSPVRVGQCQPCRQFTPADHQVESHSRSEERRVGQEWRS